ncbi:hypothetical protein [Bacteroides heparinolyticus]|uniref:hypothetical protein n=1 Tax=Prevotella heparinolytica TaxID=28113 RepID=UPI0035A15A34
MHKSFFRKLMFGKQTNLLHTSDILQYNRENGSKYFAKHTDCWQQIIVMLHAVSRYFGLPCEITDSMFPETPELTPLGTAS